MSNPAGITAVPRCVYCGRRTRAVTCGEHADLPALDPDWPRFMLYRAEKFPQPHRGSRQRPKHALWDAR